MSKEIVYWKQRNGVLISIDDMDVNHLRNVLKMIVKNSSNHKMQNNCPHNATQALEIADIDHHEFESDLGPMFNDDEARCNQW